MNTIKDVFRYLSMGYTILTHDFILKMNDDGIIKDQNNWTWGIEETDPNDYRVKCRFFINKQLVAGCLLYEKNGWATVIVDGYECSNQIPIGEIEQI